MNPQVDDVIVRTTVNDFCIFVSNALRQGSKCNTIGSITFRHDVYKVLFGNKSELDSSDFSSEYFPDGWSERYIKSSSTEMDGVVVDFPIHTWKRIAICRELKSYYVRNGKPVEKKNRFREVVKFEIVKINKTVTLATAI